MAEFFDFILAHLQWLWLAVMVLCIVIEAVTFSLTTVWAAVSALFMIFFCKLASTNTGVWFFGLTTSCAVWQAVASIWNLVPTGMLS